MSKRIGATGLIVAAVWFVLAAPAGAAVNGTYTNPIDEFSGNRSLSFVVKDNKIISGEWNWGWMCGDPEFQTYSYTGRYPAYLGNNPNPFPIPLAADGSFEATDSFGPYDDPLQPGYNDTAVTLKGRIVGGSASGTLHQVDHTEEYDGLTCTSYGEEWTANVEGDPLACASAEAKVKALKRKLKEAKPKQKAALKAKLKRAKEKAKEACAGLP